MTRKLFQDFLHENQLSRTEKSTRPFVYVEPDEKSIQVITNVLDLQGAESEILAIGVDQKGMLEYFSTEE